MVKVSPGFVVAVIAMIAGCPGASPHPNTGGALPKGALADTSAAQRLERGKLLVDNIGCTCCHSATCDKSNELPSGGEPKPSWGRGQVPNITSDPDTGIGRWTDQDIIDLLRTGQKPDGTRTGYPMPIPALRDLTDEDAAAIVSYLRSLPRVRHETSFERITPEWPVQERSPAPLNPDDPVAYGEYLTTTFRCGLCHSPHRSRQAYDFDPTKMFAGNPGFVYDHTPYGSGVIAPKNLTPDNTNGIGEWSEERLIKAIWYHPSKLLMFNEWKTGWDKPLRVDPGTGFRLPEKEMKAMAAYFRSLPPVNNQVPARTVPRPGFEDIDKLPYPFRQGAH